MTNATEDGVMLTSDLPGRLHSGKIRDIYELPDDRLLVVATDRLSAFDVVMPGGVPRKGEVLTRLSAYWFERTRTVVPNAFIAVLEADNAAELGVDAPPEYYGRSMVMRRAQPLAIECVVRGYITGSGWSSYERDGMISGIRLAPGLAKSERLVDPLFTPTTKAEPPEHDAPMTYAEAETMFGEETANVLKLRSLALYRYGADVLRERGIILADTKFEFGMLDGEVTLIDEVMTPDSSRFWPVEGYEAGRDQPSFDKQPFRDWLETLDWDKQTPGPDLPPEIIEATSTRYQQAYELATGEPLPPPAKG